jgi:hypothetical protein
MFSLICEYGLNSNKQYYEKKVILRGECMRERKYKRRKLRRLMYSLYKNEYRIFKPASAIIRKALR